MYLKITKYGSPRFSLLQDSLVAPVIVGKYLFILYIVQGAQNFTSILLGSLPEPEF